MAVQAVRAHSDFFLTAWTVGPALVDITLQLADTFSRHRFSARLLNFLSALHPGGSNAPWLSSVPILGRISREGVALASPCAKNVASIIFFLTCTSDRSTIRRYKTAQPAAVHFLFLGCFDPRCFRD